MLNLFENDNGFKKMQEKHDRQLQKMRLKNKLEIEKDKLNNDLNLAKLESEESQIDVTKEIFKLKNIVNKDNITVKTGKRLKFWAILVTLISTVITVANGFYEMNDNILMLLGFIGGVVCLQFTVYLISSQQTRIKQDFSTHYVKCLALKYILLAVSIYNNFKFFTHSTDLNFATGLVMLMLCVGIDLIAVFITSLAYDQITLNTFSDNSKGLIYKALYNLSYKFISKISNNYDKNIKNCDKSELDILTNDNNNDIIKTQSTGNNSLNMNNSLNLLNLTNEEIEKYISYAVGNKNSDDYLPSYKEIGKETGLGKNKAYEIKRYLDQIGKTVVVGRRTKLIA